MSKEIELPKWPIWKEQTNKSVARDKFGQKGKGENYITGIKYIVQEKL